jgi:hypothetical protein
MIRDMIEEVEESESESACDMMMAVPAPSM